VQKASNKKQKANGKRRKAKCKVQSARGKVQEANGKELKANGKGQNTLFFINFMFLILRQNEIKRRMLLLGGKFILFVWLISQKTRVKFSPIVSNLFITEFLDKIAPPQYHLTAQIVIVPNAIYCSR
jgi:hypothetical protein